MSEPVSKTKPNQSDFGLRKFGRVNWLGLYTLYHKEVMRFMSIYLQTIIAPVISMMLFLAIFSISIGKFRAEINGVEFIVFIVPGLIMNAMMQNAFANNSSSLMMGKMQGNIVDILMPPISAGEMMFAITMGGATRGFLVGLSTGIVMAFVVDFEIQHYFMVILFGILGSMVMALLGLLAGLWADKFDQMGMITNFVITPLTFLSGTFYSIKQLPEFAQLITKFNPFFYLIDGFRYGFIGQSESNIYLTLLVSVGTCVVLWVWGYYLIKIGYKIKS
ncbi:MAG: ABC transporter permease [OCS116 cluster bacterium]|uniref:Transport permease protein n=1 Tax=OCS116 cluster bacterium TaxID=2030921 RepID=A0A2A4YX55_9PROT|nr:ABC transporter permease [OCS116 cluster bacterium]